MPTDATWLERFSIERVEPITVSQTQSRSEGTHSDPLRCAVFYWRILIFDFKMSPELWFHSSKGEAFPNIGQSQRWKTPAPWDVCNVLQCMPLLLRHAHVVLGVT